ncbi:uncharacterized protein TNCV_464321 [Trichonephila clavipes]|nr:uncharacterized protein TNCV_464321 [Trichonephila clavipes]
MAREARQLELELRKLELSQQNQPLNDESGRRVEIRPKIQLTQITAKFDEKHDEISLYLINFERKAELAQVPKKRIGWPTCCGSYLTTNYSRSQSEIQGDLHNGAQRINPENRVGSSFRIIPEQYFSGVENIDDFLENIDHNLAYYEIPAQLACAYVKDHLKGRALDWFEVLGYRVIEDKATDYAHLKQALSEQFPVVRYRSELETRFYSSSQRRDQPPSDFIYELLKIHKVLKQEMSEEKLIDHVVSRLEPQISDYVEVRHPQNTANLLQIVDKYEERFMHRQIRGSSEGFRSSNPNENNHYNTRHRQENWRENGNNARYANNSRPQGEFN